LKKVNPKTKKMIETYSISNWKWMLNGKIVAGGTSGESGTGGCGGKSGQIPLRYAPPGSDPFLRPLI